MSVDIPAVTRVTPDGHDVGVWAARVAAARRLGLDELRAVLRASGPNTALLVVSAHPDDETFGAGRLISAWSRSAGPCAALVATAGEACVDHVGPRPLGLADQRLVEWRAALQVLGAAEVGVAQLPDGRLAAYESLLEEVVREAAELLWARGCLVMAAPYAEDPDPDHRAAGRAAATVAAELDIPLLGYPVWLTYWGDPANCADPLWRLETDDRAERAYAEAVACFPTQLAPMRPELAPVVSPAMLAHHRQQLLLPQLSADGADVGPDAGAGQPRAG